MLMTLKERRRLTHKIKPTTSYRGGGKPKDPLLPYHAQKRPLLTKEKRRGKTIAFSSSSCIYVEIILRENLVKSQL